MKPMAAAMVCLFAVLGAGASAQNPSEPGLEFYRIGDLPLESGEAIHDFSIAYMTQGTLNAKKSNAVLMVTAISGNHHRIDYLIGPGRGLDTDHLFVIKTNAIGNGLTTSPSNSATQHGRHSLTSPHATWCRVSICICCCSTLASTIWLRLPVPRWAACRPCNGVSAIPT